MIRLTQDVRGSAFDEYDLVKFLNDHMMDYIIQGQQQCSLADHTKPSSLDYWLRTNYAEHPDTKQAVNEVVEQLVDTELFEVAYGLLCPDSGRKCKGLRLKKDSGKTNENESSSREPTEPSCRFCFGNIKDRIVEEWENVLAFEDRFPVSKGHLLIVTKRHTLDWFSMSEQERREADALISALRNRLLESDKTITGFNVGMNCGRSAGQTIFHAHIHLIPRRDGDTPDPTGGVRGVIPDKMCYCLDDT